jgi:hypothetical protein
MNLDYGLFDRDHEDVRKPYKPRGTGLHIDNDYVASRSSCSQGLVFSTSRSEALAEALACKEDMKPPTPCLCVFLRACMTHSFDQSAAEGMGISKERLLKLSKEWGIERPSDRRATLLKIEREEYIRELQKQTLAKYQPASR